MSTTPSRALLAAGEGATAAASGPRAVDRLLAAWTLATGLLLLLPGRPPEWPSLALFHAALAWVALQGPGAAQMGAALHSRMPAVARFLRDWYPLLIVPLLYSELEPLNIAVHGGRMFDPLIIAVEQAVFRGQPSRDWAAALPSLPLSELLHGAYLSYYFIMYVPALLIWLRCTRAEFRQAVFTILLGFLAHYIFFILFPVEGPRYRYPAPTGGIEEGALYQLTHRLLESGSSRGAAFPSSHVGASAAVAIATLRRLPVPGVVVALLTVGIALGAVYGGFHYAIDAVAGMVLGTGVAVVAPRVQRLLDPRDPAR